MDVNENKFNNGHYIISVYMIGLQHFVLRVFEPIFLNQLKYTFYYLLTDDQRSKSDF